MQQFPKRELELNFPINQIKATIDAIITAGSGRGYLLMEKNDMLSTYRIAITSGLLAGIMSITLRTDGENKTLWASEIMPAAGSTVAPAILARLQDEFLNILSKGLAGEEVNSQLIKGNKPGCLGVLLLLVSLTFILSYLIFH